MLKAVIFDMDGLLIDSEVITFKYYQEEFSAYGHDLTKAFYEKLLGTNKAHVLARFTDLTGSETLSQVIMDRVHHKVNNHFIEEGVPLKKGAKELTRFLAKKKIKTGLATSSDRSRVFTIIEKSDVIEKMDIIVCGNEVSRSKPHPDIFQNALNLLGVLPHEALVIEDSENGILAAHSAGIPCINVPDMKEPSQFILDKADFVASSLLEVIDYIKPRLASAV